MALQMVLCEICPQKAVGAEMAKALGLERAHLTDRCHFRVASVLVGHELGKGDPDIARGKGAPADRVERMGQELGERRLAVGAGDGGYPTTPEQGGKVDFGHADARRLARHPQPGMVQGKPWGIDRKAVALGRLRRELGAGLVIDDGRGANLTKESDRPFSAYGAAKHGGGPRQALAQEIGKRTVHANGS